MKDKDTKLLEEAYSTLKEQGPEKLYTDIVDETGITPIEAVINKDNTATIRFSNSYTISRIDPEALKNFIDFLNDVLTKSEI